MNYYNMNTALFNYVSLRASSTVAFHPTVKTVGFPGFHFVTGRPHSVASCNFHHTLLVQYCKKPPTKRQTA